MTELGKIIIILVGILAIYGLWTLAMVFSLQYAHRNAPIWHNQARELTELAVTWQQHLAGANRYFNSATQIDAAPYANPVSRARKIVKYGYDLAGQAVRTADRASRRDIAQKPPSNRFLIVPPLIEIVAWFRHAMEVQRVTDQLAKVRQVRQELAAIDSEIAVLGRRQKRQFEELRTRATELEAERKSLAGPHNPLITEGVSLAGAMSSLDMVFEGMLPAEDPPRQNVVDAYRWYVELQMILNEVDMKMRRRPSPAQDANYALQVALRHYARFEQALAVDSKQYGPFPLLSTQALNFKKQMGQISGMLQAQKYQPALEQAQLLPLEIQAQHNTLEQIKLWRGKASELYGQAYGITADYEAGLAVARQTIEMDISDPLMQSVRLLLRGLDDLRLSEDLVKLTEANQIKRDFDLKMVEVESTLKTFEERAARFTALQKAINQASVDETCKRAVDLAVALGSSHAVYSQPVNADILTTLRAGILSEWRLFAVQLDHPRESQLESLARLMAHPLELQTQLNTYCDDAARALTQKGSDKQSALTNLRQIDELMSECNRMAQNGDAAMLATVAGFQAHRDDLERELKRADGDRPNFSALNYDVTAALGQMHDFAKGYNEQLSNLLKQMGALRQSFETVKLELRDMASSGALDLQVDGRYHNDIQTWIIAFHDQATDAPLREVQARLDAGSRLMTDTRSYIQRLKQGRDAFLNEQKRVEDHATEVQTSVEHAIHTGRGTHADDTREQPDRIAPIRQQMDKANATLARLSPSAPCYTLTNGRADLKLADSLLDYAELMVQNL